MMIDFTTEDSELFSLSLKFGYSESMLRENFLCHYDSVVTQSAEFSLDSIKHKMNLGSFKRNKSKETNILKFVGDKKPRKTVMLTMSKSQEI